MPNVKVSVCSCLVFLATPAVGVLNVHRASVDAAPNDIRQEALEEQLNKALLQSCGQPCVQMWTAIAQASNSSSEPTGRYDHLLSLAEMAEQQLRSSQYSKKRRRSTGF